MGPRVGPFDRLAAFLADVVVHTGRFAPVVLFCASFIEYVFPPFPGDTIVVLGAWYAVQGTISWPAAFAAVTLGAVAGAWLDWWVGCSIAPALSARAGLRGPLDAARLARFESAYRRWGGLVLVANRFLPGIRAFLFVAAGAARIPLWKVLLLGGLSAALWNALLLGVGALIARNLAEMSAILARYTCASWIAIGVVVALVVGRALLRRWRAAG
jgi:membrane protein DedA with SNARE-associated domain